MGEKKNREYLVADIDEVTVKGFNSNDAKIAEFQLSNADGQDQASGSLDNIEAGTYKVQVDASSSDYSDAFKGYDGADYTTSTCRNNNIDDNLFEGEGTVTVSGDGSAATVSIFMEACHDPLTFGANGLPDLVFPSYVQEVSSVVTSANGVLRKNDAVTVTVTIQNSNVATTKTGFNYTKSVLEAKFDTTGDKRTTTPAWKEGTTTTTDLAQTNKYFVKSDAQSVFTFSYNATDAGNTYTTELQITPYAYKGDGTGVLDSKPSVADLSQGSSFTRNYVVAPVGDLDLEVVYFTGLRIKGDTSFGSTTSDNQLTNSVFTQPTQNPYSGECSDRSTEAGWKYVVPDSLDSYFDVDFVATSLYGIARTMNFTATSDNTDCTVSVALKNDFFGPASGFTVDAGTTDNLVLDFPVRVTVNPTEYTDFEKDVLKGSTSVTQCTITVTGTTTGTTVTGTISKTVTAKFQVKVLPTDYVCDYTKKMLPETNFIKQNNFDQDIPCPSLRAISWDGSHFADGPACNSGNGNLEIKFCAQFIKGFKTEYNASDFQLEVYKFSGGTGTSKTFTGVTKDDHIGEVEDDACLEARTQLTAAVQATLEFQSYKIVIPAEGFKVDELTDLCIESKTTQFGARIKAAAKNDLAKQSQTCSETSAYDQYSSSDVDDHTIFCPAYKDLSTETCTAAKTTEAPTRKLLSKSAGCPSGPFACPADNRLPFDIKIEDGRLTVAMDTSAIADKKIVINANPTGLLPKRSRFIASDFSAVSQSWGPSLRAKLDFVINDATTRQNLVPGATAQDLVACCGFSLEEATVLSGSMADIVSAERAQIFKPTITVTDNNGGNNGNNGGNNAGQTTSTQTTTTHTEKSSDGSSSGSLLVVVAVAAVLVLVAVIALAIFTVKSNKQSQRVVDLRGGNAQQSSWQKGGAMESDF